MKHALYLSGALIAFSLSPAYAQVQLVSDTIDPEDREIVSVGQRLGDVRKDELTSPVSLLSQSDIEARGQGYISDLLRSLPGVSVNRSGPAGSLTQIRIRGSEANHVLVLIDGVEAGNPNTGEFDFAGLRTEDVLRIELLRGEQSALYGSDAIGGVLNIITKASSGAVGYDVSYELGSFDTRAAQGGAVLSLGGVGLGDQARLSLNATYFETDGYDISDAGIEEDDGSESYGFNAGLTGIKLGPFRLTANAATTELISEFDTDSDFDGRLDDTLDTLTTESTRARVAVAFDLAGFTNSLTYALTQTDTANPEAGFQNDTKGTRQQYSWIAGKTFKAHSVSVLAESETEKFTNFGGVDAGQNQTQSTTNEALAVDYRFAPGALSLTASARQDFNSRFDDAATYRVGAGYAFSAIGGRVRGSYGTAVKNPSMTELFGFFPAFFVGNPELVPETSEGFNLGYEQDIGTDFTVSVDYFQSDLENEIFTDFGVFPSTARNRATQSTREGVEVEMRWDLHPRLGFSGAATVLNSEENGVEEIRRPEFTASGALRFRATDRVSLTGTIDHTGDQTDQDFATFPAAVVTLDAFTLIGLNAQYKITDQLTFSLRGENLGNTAYEEVLGYASQPRSVYGQLRARF